MEDPLPRELLRGISAKEIGRVLDRTLRTETNTPAILLANVYVDGGPWESDFVRVLESGYWTEYEIKVTKADYLADFKKTRWHITNKHKYYAGEEDRRYHRRPIPKPKQFFFVVPKGLLDDMVVPHHCGVMEYDPRRAGSKITTTVQAPRLKKHTRVDAHGLFILGVKSSSRWSRAFFGKH